MRTFLLISFVLLGLTAQSFAEDALPTKNGSAIPDFMEDGDPLPAFDENRGGWRETTGVDDTSVGEDYSGGGTGDGRDNSSIFSEAIAPGWGPTTVTVSEGNFLFKKALQSIPNSAVTDITMVKVMTEKGPAVLTQFTIASTLLYMLVRRFVPVSIFSMNGVLFSIDPANNSL